MLFRSDDDPKDKSYQPLKHSNALNDKAPKCIYTSDVEEVSSETEFGCELVSGKRRLEKMSDIFRLLMLISEKKGKRNGSARLITNQKDNHQKRKFQHTRQHTEPNRKSLTMICILI